MFTYITSILLDISATEDVIVGQAVLNETNELIFKTLHEEIITLEGISESLLQSMRSTLMVAPALVQFFTVYEKDDDEYSAIGIDINVNLRVFTEEMNVKHTFVGERELATLFMNNQDRLYKRCFTKSMSHYSYEIKRHKRLKTYLTNEQMDLLCWIQHKEEKFRDNYVVQCPLYVEFENTGYIFCFKQHTFMLRGEGVFHELQLKGGVIGGDHNSGKCRVIEQLIYETQLEDTTCPSFLKRMNKTLIVSSAVDHWCHELSTLDVLKVTKKTETAVNYEKLLACDVVLVTPGVLHQITKHTHFKHNSRANAHAVNETVELNYFYWGRIIMDECAIGTQYFKNIYSQVFWSLDGGLFQSSLNIRDKCLKFNSPHIKQLQTHSLLDEVFYALPAIAVNYYRNHTIFTELNTQEKYMYNLLKQYNGDRNALSEVCFGSVKPFEEYINIVYGGWKNALQAGQETFAILRQLVSINMEDNIEDIDSVINEIQQHMDETGTTPETSEHNDMNMRRDYFCKVIQDMQTNVPPQCSICLTHMCDTVSICGHLLCHECCIHMFHDSDAQLQYCIQCPTCRYDLDSSDVFWVYPRKQQGSQEVALHHLIKRKQQERSVLFVCGAHKGILKHFTSKRIPFTNTDYRAEGVTLFVMPIEKMHSVKMTNIKNVIFYNIPPSIVSSVEKFVTHSCIIPTGGVIDVYRFSAQM